MKFSEFLEITNAIQTDVTNMCAILLSKCNGDLNEFKILLDYAKDEISSISMLSTKSDKIIKEN